VTKRSRQVLAMLNKKDQFQEVLHRFR